MHKHGLQCIEPWPFRAEQFDRISVDLRTGEGAFLSMSRPRRKQHQLARIDGMVLVTNERTGFVDQHRRPPTVPEYWIRLQCRPLSNSFTEKYDIYHCYRDS